MAAPEEMFPVAFRFRPLPEPFTIRLELKEMSPELAVSAIAPVEVRAELLFTVTEPPETVMAPVAVAGPAIVADEPITVIGPATLTVEEPSETGPLVSDFPRTKAAVVEPIDPEPGKLRVVGKAAAAGSTRRVPPVVNELPAPTERRFAIT